MPLTCNVCLTPLGEPVYRSARDVSISSLSVHFPLPTLVYCCDRCGHLQTPPLDNLAEYYDKAYKIHLESEEADQLYPLTDGTKVYRSEHQAMVLADKLELPEGASLLDYGCGKAPTMRRLAARRPDLAIHLFDISADYQSFWHAFTTPERCATYTPKPEWTDYFDAVTSFYALEHVEDLHGSLKAVRNLLKPGGLFYAIVPNWPTNIADVIVVDHINHFWSGSYRHVLASHGFTVESLDTEAHYGALVVVCRKTEPTDAWPEPEALEANRKLVQETTAYWQGVSDRVRAFEAGEGQGRRAAIYGSGVYGNFIATCIADWEPVRCFLDQNPHQQGKTILDRPIIAPEALSPEVGAVYVGLNPTIARREMAKISAWEGRDLAFFYL